MQLPDEQRHRYGNNNIEYDKRDIIQNCVSKDNPDVSCGKQEFKILKTIQSLLNNTLQEPSP